MLGELRVLRAELAGENTWTELGWQAEAELELGTRLTLSWSEAADEAGSGGADDDAGAGGTVELEVRRLSRSWAAEEVRSPAVDVSWKFRAS